MPPSGADQVPHEFVRLQLEQLRASPIFANSPRLIRFLHYTVEATLKGEGDRLKEYSIGVDVYDRKPSYQGNEHSIVRTEARRLRNKLKEYYEKEGAQDRVLIYYRVGSYMPLFRWAESPSNPVSPSTPPVFAVSQIERPGVTIAVVPFTNHDGTVDSGAIAAGITDDLIHRIMRTDGCRVVSLKSDDPLRPGATQQTSSSGVWDVQQVITGSVRTDASRVKVTVFGVHPLGLETWSETFEFDSNGTDLITIETQIASALMTRVAPQKSAVRKMREKLPELCFALFPEILSAEVLLECCDHAATKNAMEKFHGLSRRGPVSPRVQCGITRAHWQLASLGELTGKADIKNAAKAAAAAMSIDPEMGEAHGAKASSLALALDAKGSEQAYRVALVLGTNPGTKRQYAELLMSLGRFEEASIQLTHAGEVDPFSASQKVSTARLRYLAWQSNETTSALVRVSQYGAVPIHVLLFEAQLLVNLGKASKALDIAENVLRSSDRSLVVLTEVAGILALAGQGARARMLCESFDLLSKRTGVSRLYQARLCVALQEEEAFETFLELALNAWEPQLCWLSVDPRFATLTERTCYKQALTTLRDRIA